MIGRHSCSPVTVNARVAATSHPVAITMMTGHGSSKILGRAGGSAPLASAGSSLIGFQPSPKRRTGTPNVFGCTSQEWLTILGHVKDAEARLANDLSLAVMRLARQLRFRRPESSVSLSQLSALSTLAKEGAMTPGALALRERVRPPSMSRVIASLADLGFVARSAHPADGRQVLVSVSPSGVELIEAERKASQEWLKERLSHLDPDQRKTLLVAADLMRALVDESA